MEVMIRKRFAENGRRRRNETRQKEYELEKKMLPRISVKKT
jgi:hypothetical protein